MAASVRSAASNHSGTATATSVVVTKPSGTADGDLLYGFVSTNDSGPTITAPSGFAAVIGAFSTGGTNVGALACYRKTAGGSEPADYAWQVAAATRFCVAMLAVQGADTATPEDGTGTKTTGSANPGTAADAPSVDPATTDALLLVAMGGTVAATGTPVTATPPSGMAEQADVSTQNTGAARNSSLEVSSLALADGSATGVKTNTVTSSISWGGLAVAVRAGSTAHTRTVTDAAGVTDAAAQAATAARAATDPVGLADAVTVVLTGSQQTVADLAELADAAAQATVADRTLAEVAGLADTVQVAASAAQAVTVRGASSANTGGPQQTSLTGTLPAGVQAGDVAYAAVWNNNQATSAALTTPSGWAAVVPQFDNAGAGGSMACYRRVLDGSETQVVITASAATRLALGIVVLAGADTTIPEDATGTDPGGTAAAAAVAAPSVAGTAGGLLVTAHGGQANVAGDQPTWTPPAGMTERADTTTTSGAAKNATVEVNTLALAASGATGTKTATASVNLAHYAGLAVAVKPAAPAGVAHTRTVSDVVGLADQAARAAAYAPGATAAQPVWASSAIDATGMQVAVFFESAGSAWYVGCDVAGINGINRPGAPPGLFDAFNLGSGVNAAGELDGPLQQGAAINGDGQKLVWLSGRGSSGGILRRATDVAGAQWQVATTGFFGDVRVEGGISGTPRRVGHTRIAVSGQTVWVACQRTGDGNSGIARSSDGGLTFSEWRDFAIDRHYTSLVGSPQFAGVLYASADNTVTGAGPAGGNPAVYVATGATGGSPAFTRIDTQGAFAGTIDTRQVRVVAEAGQDVLYAVVGAQDAAAQRGVWKCVVGNPTAGGWTAASVAWTKISTGIDTAADWNALIAQRNPAGTATRLLIGCISPTTVLSGTIPGSTATFRASHYRSLDSGATWEAITAGANVSTTVYGTGGPGEPPAETWVLVDIGIETLSNSIIGGPAHLVHDLDLDPATDQVVSAGKSGAWITLNPWAASAASVAWRPFVRQMGSVISRGVLVHPSDKLKVLAADVDRSVYTWTDGAAAQPRCHLPQIVDAGVSPSAIYGTFVRPSGTVLIGREGAPPTVLSNPDPWVVGGGTWTKDSLASVTSGDVVGVCEFTSVAAATVRLAASSGADVAGAGGIFRKVGAGAWSLVQAFAGVVTQHQDPVTFVAADASDLVWCLSPTSGLWRSADAGLTWANAWPKTVPAGNQRWWGRVARDSAAATTLYVSWDDGGLWKVTAADQGALNANGTTASGAISASKLTAAGLLDAASRVGALAVDPTDGALLACLLANDAGGPTILRSDDHGATFTEVADAVVYPEAGTLALWVAKRADRVYVSTDGSGMFVGVLVTAAATGITDLVGLTDQVTYALGVVAAQARTDPLGLVDAASQAAAAAQAATDLLGLADAAAQAATTERATTDPAGITDQVTVVLERTVTDPAGLADAAAAAQQAIRAATSPVGLTDAPSQVMAAERATADAVGLTDAAARVATAERTVAEVAGLADVATREATVQQTATDPVGLTDQTAAAADRTVTDAVGLTDAAAPVADTARTATSPAGLADAAARQATSAQTTTSAVGLADAATQAASVTLERTATDPVALTDTVAAAQAASVIVTDPAGVTDQAAASQQASRTATSPAGLADQAAVARTSTVTLADLAGVTDLADRALAAAPLLADPLGLADLAAASSPVTGRTLTDLLGLADSVTAAMVARWEASGAVTGTLDAAGAVTGAREAVGAASGILEGAGT